MPRKSSSKSAAGQEGNPVRRARKPSSPAAASSAETAATANTLQTSAPAEARAMAAAAGAGAGITSQPVITREEIERLAYSYWVARGCQGGSPEEDWFRAEQELRRQRGLSDSQG